MIALLSGQILEQNANHLILDVNGVGYLINVSSSTLNQIQGLAGNTSLFIEMIVREDSLTLYGFYTSEEKKAFTLLQSVQGVGAKAAISILSVLTPDGLKQAILSSDKAMVSRADGVGPKLAQRIVNELAEKIGKLPIGHVSGDDIATSTAGSNDSTLAQDALSALVNLGYSQSEAWTAVQIASSRPESNDLGQLVNLALKEIGQKR